MRFYSVHKSSSEGSHGYEWFTNKDEAQKCMREWHAEGEGCSADLDVIDLVPTKGGIWRLLRHYASHPNNG